MVIGQENLNPEGMDDAVINSDKLPSWGEHLASWHLHIHIFAQRDLKSCKRVWKKRAVNG